jgi:hypothetical protein
LETFEFTVISEVHATLYEKVRIKAESYDAAVSRIEDADYYAEDGEILDRRYDDIDYQELVDILEPEYFKGSDNNPTEEKPLWTSEY